MSNSACLNNIALKGVYRTNEDSLLKDFYIPCLSNSIRYDRAVGYFSSALFSEALQGISEFISNNGQIRLIIGHPLSVEEYNVVKECEGLEEVNSYIEERYLQITNAIFNEADINRLEIFKYLVASGRLELKFALRKVGMYHEKMGRFRDELGNEVIFQGSANETEFANSSSKNFESIMVFSNWKTPENVFEEYTRPFVNGFERLWNNEERDIITLDISSSLYDKITESVTDITKPFEYQDELKLELFKQRDSSNSPSLPDMLNGVQFKLKEHQKLAIEDWRRKGECVDGGIRGILKLATGAGKTITSIACSIRLYDMLKRQSLKYSFVIAAPYDNLAEQWVDILKHFGFSPIKCYRSSDKWKSELHKAKQRIITDMIDNVCIVVVNKTLRTKGFQSYLQEFNELTYMFFVGDECHNHSSKSMVSSLPNCSFRMGLSATPYYEENGFIEYSDEKKMILEEYYGEVVSTYDLSDALKDDVLTPYNYHVYPVHMTEAESEEYISLTKQIAKKFAVGERLSDDNSSLTGLLSKRSRLLANLNGKLSALKGAMSSIQDKTHTLVYCGDGYNESDDGINHKQVDLVSGYINKLGWTNQKFTADEGKLARVQIMNSFKKGEIDALVAIKVLDEGIDVPVCKRAFILASSKNPRQYVQRRGRILRKSEGKSCAEIYDFLILPSDDIVKQGYSRSLLMAEFSRLVEFKTLAMNSAESGEKIKMLMNDYNIELGELEYML